MQKSRKYCFRLKSLYIVKLRTARLRSFAKLLLPWLHTDQVPSPLTVSERLLKGSFVFSHLFHLIGPDILHMFKAIFPDGIFSQWILEINLLVHNGFLRPTY